MISHEIAAASRNANDAADRAEAEDPCIDQDWCREQTVYRFIDGSVLIISGPTVNAYNADPDYRR